MKLQFLLLEDSVLDAELIQATLQQGDLQFDLVRVQSQGNFLAALQTQAFDLILSDYSLPEFDGVSALALAQQICPQVPFIFVSATLGEELAIEMLKGGATDYVLKQRLGRLVPSVQRALRETRERRKRQHVETALREAEYQYRLLFEQSPFGVLLIRVEDLSFAEFNAQSYLQLEYTREEFAQLKLPQIEAMKDEAEILAHSRRIIRRGFDQFESKHLNKFGELRDVLVTAQPVMIEGEQYLHAIWQDITDRKLAETAIQERSDRLKLLYETTSDLLSTDQPIALLDDLFQKLSTHIELDCYLNFLVEQTEDGTLLRLVAYQGISDQAAQAMQQLNTEQTLCGLAIEQNRPVVLPHAQQATQPRAAAVRSLGITAYVGFPLQARGRLLGALSFGSRRRTYFTNEELDLLQATADQVAVALERASLLISLQQQTEQLTQANQIKDEFLAVLSHELRTPLNPILGWARLLRSRDYDPATTNRALEIIERNAKIQTQLIEDLLDVSRILRGKLRLTVAPVDLGATIQAALETVQLSAEAKGVSLQFNILEADISPSTDADAGSGPSSEAGKFHVLGDASRLQQVVWNLLSNAVKFTPEGGRIEVSLSTVMQAGTMQAGTMQAGTMQAGTMQAGTADAQSTPGKPYAQVTVTDTGKGIEPDFLPYVFDYFRQADGSTTRTFGGLGLGLAIVRHLVELHGGTIHALSAGEGTGASFTVLLPLFQPQHHSVPKPTFSLAASTLPLRGVNVLAVDDEKDALEFITFLLEQFGARVIPAASASAALEAFQQVQPDILVSDIGMPLQDGYALLRQVRQFSAAEGGNVPAIALTAYARDEDSQQALAAGFQKHLAKPVEPSDLLQAIVALVKVHPGRQV